MIREATTDDLARIVAMGRRFRQETVYAQHVEENPGQMEATAMSLLASVTGVIAVAEQDGAIVGMLGAGLFTHPMSGVLFAGELFLWVEPEARGLGGLGVRLLKWVEQWARDRGAMTMQMVAPTADVEALYDRMGYDRVEVTYQKGLA